MRAKKALLEKSLDALVEKAEDCSDLAKMQRASADRQHETAHRLEQLGHALEIDAAELKNELELDAEQAARLRKDQSAAGSAQGPVTPK